MLFSKNKKDDKGIEYVIFNVLCGIVLMIAVSLVGKILIDRANEARDMKRIDMEKHKQAITIVNKP